MNSTLLYDNFAFLNLNLSNFHYTDNRNGSPRYYIGMMKHGTAKIVSAETVISVNEGDVFFIPKNLSYQSYWYGDRNKKIEFVSLGFYNLYTDDPLNRALQIVACGSSTKEKILAVPTSESQITAYTLSIFYQVVSDIVPLLKTNYESNYLLLSENIKKNIRRNPSLTMREIAAICGISEAYVYAVFKKQEHTTPNAYRQRVLCEKGIDLLMTTDKKS